MKYILILLASFITMSSCNTEKKLSRVCKRLKVICPSEIKSSNDSIYIYKEMKKDTIITLFTPADTLSIMAMVICDKHNKAQLAKQYFKFNKHKIDVEIRNGILKTNYFSLIDSLKIQLSLKEKIITIKNNKKKVLKFISYKIRVIDYVCRSIVGTILLLLLIFLLIKFKIK